MECVPYIMHSSWWTAKEDVNLLLASVYRFKLNTKEIGFPMSCTS